MTSSSGFLQPQLLSGFQGFLFEGHQQELFRCHRNEKWNHRGPTWKPKPIPFFETLSLFGSLLSICAGVIKRLCFFSEEPLYLTAGISLWRASQTLRPQNTWGTSLTGILLVPGGEFSLWSRRHVWNSLWNHGGLPFTKHPIHICSDWEQETTFWGVDEVIPNDPAIFLRFQGI